MKKIIITLMLLGTICVNTFAQEYDVVEVGEEFTSKSNEVYLSVGQPSFISLFGAGAGEVIEAIVKGMFGGNSNDGSETPKKKGLPVSFTAGYNHYFGEYFGLGGFASFENVGNPLITVQAKITGQYGWEHFKIYHSLSGGIMINPNGGSKPVTGIGDLTYLGLKFDFKNFNVFVEGSFPSTGIKIGASYKF